MQAQHFAVHEDAEGDLRKRATVLHGLAHSIVGMSNRLLLHRLPFLRRQGLKARVDMGAFGPASGRSLLLLAAACGSLLFLLPPLLFGGLFSTALSGKTLQLCGQLQQPFGQFAESLLARPPAQTRLDFLA